MLRFPLAPCWFPVAIRISSQLLSSHFSLSLSRYICVYCSLLPTNGHALGRIYRSSCTWIRSNRGLRARGNAARGFPFQIVSQRSALFLLSVFMSSHSLSLIVCPIISHVAHVEHLLSVFTLLLFGERNIETATSKLLYTLLHTTSSCSAVIGT